MSIRINWHFLYLLKMKTNLMKNIILLAAITILFFCYSCNTKNRHDINIKNIQIEDIQIKRYGKAIFEIDKNNLKEELQKLQPQFGIFLDGDLDDTLNLIKINEFISDTFLISIKNDCELLYPDLDELETALTLAFKHYKYYYSKSDIPEVFTYISGFDYDHAVQYYNNNLLIALDLYLGKDYPKYKKLGLPAYKIRTFRREFIIPNCMQEIAKSKLSYKKIGTTLLDAIINEGKILWFTDAMLPNTPDSLKIVYSTNQIQWARENEELVWAFLIENELFYSTEKEIMQKFIFDGPFTSFFGKDSPPRLGWWIGWQIINSYMSKNENISLSNLMKNYDAQNILSNSGYKPGR